MKWQRLFFFFFLIPSLIYGLNESECKTIRNNAIAQWSRHEELIQQFNQVGQTEQGLKFLRESLVCCKQALSELETILKDIAGKSKKQRKEDWRVDMKKACKKDKKTINREIPEIEKGVNTVLSSIAFNRAKALYEKSLEKAEEARSKKETCPTRTLSNAIEVATALQGVAKLYREAETLCQKAITTLTSAPTYNEANNTVLLQTLGTYKEVASSHEKEATEWPGKVLCQKASLKERLATLSQDSELFEEKGLKRSSYELKQQTLPILETLIQNSEGEEKETLENHLKGLQISIALFEKEADQTRLTETSLSLSPEEFKAREDKRREIFFKSDFVLDGSNFFQAFIHQTLKPAVIALDGPCEKGVNEYGLYLDQFYRFLLETEDPIKTLNVKVYKQGDLVHEENISLPVKGSLAWRSYLLKEGSLFIPETNLEKEFGLKLHLSYISDPKCPSLLLSQKASDPQYYFTFSLGAEAPLYTCHLLAPPPWQLDALRRPRMQTPNRIPYKNTHFYTSASNIEAGKNLEENYPLLNEFIRSLKKDPLALAAHVQNEIALVEPYCKQEEGVFQAPGIQRNALRVYLEGQGSPWEQCQLLVYFLRKAGYQALYAMGKPYSLPKEVIENMLLCSLPEGEEEGHLSYPWVVFFDGKQWISLFPWLKEIQTNEGFDVYQFLSEEFASTDRWILRYLKGDERILKHTHPDGDDSAAKLFILFVEEHLREQGLSLDDVGIHRTQLKKQFASFEDFPSPKIDGGFNVFDLGKNSSIFAKAHIEISSHENPGKKIHATLPLTSLNCQAIPLSFKENRFHIHFIGEKDERTLSLDQTDHSLDIKVTRDIQVGTKLFSSTRVVSLGKGAAAALCFHFGGETPKLTNLAFEIFNQAKEDKKLEALLSFMGAAYFEKCGRGHHSLAKLHKVRPAVDFAFGLSKLIEGGPNAAQAKLPQVDMMFQCDSHSLSLNPQAQRPFEALTIVDISSNEHQILKDIFSDLSAVSTVKLLQLAHKYQEDLSAEGFLALDTEMLKEVEKQPEASQALYFSHLKDLDLRVLQQTRQWNIAKTLFDQDDIFSPFAYVYMTPGFVYSLDKTYKEMGTFIFHPTVGHALISSNTLLLNGGLGSPLPEYYFNPSVIQEWQLTPTNHSYKLEVPSPFDTVAPLPQPKPLPEKTSWESDVRTEHKSLWNSVADPVDIVSGSFTIDETDLILPGPFPLEIRRNYNSQNPLMGELGAGWKLSLNPFLVKQDGKLLAAEVDGSIICYSYNHSTSRWEVFPEDNPDLCNFNQKGIGSSANPFHAYIENDILHGADGSKRFFKEGLLQKWVNARGAILTFFYRGDQLARIESSHGEFFYFEYNHEGRISEIYAKDGRRISYSYSSQGDLIKVTLPNGATITYEYDHAHRLFRETKPLGQVLENIYDTQGRVIEQRSPMGPRQELIPTATFEYQDDITTVTDAVGGKTIYKVFQRQIYKIIDPRGVETLQSWFIDEESYFDAKTEQVLSWDRLGAFPKSLQSTVDKRGLRTTYLYDTKGNPIEIALHGKDLTGDGQTSILKKLSYNNNNLCIQEEVLKEKTLTTYDKDFPQLPKKIEEYHGNALISTIELKYNVQGLLEKEDNNGAITLWEYDRGFPIQKIQVTGTEDPDVVTEYAYNSQGQCIKIIQTDATYENMYDIMGNLIETQTLSPSGELLSANSIGYNLNNQPLWEQTANSRNITYFDYHASGQIKAKRQQLAPSQKVAYTLFEYDPRGFLTEEVDPLGYTTYREYDALGKILSETKENHTTKFTYEAGGFVETIATPTGAKTTRLYTTNGLLKEEVYPDGTKASFIYDHFSRPILETKNGVTWEIEYDTINHKIIQKNSETGETEIKQYDARGNLTLFTDRAGFTWQKTYDGLGRLKTEITPKGEETTYNYVHNTVICNLPSRETIITTYEGERALREETYDTQNHLIRSSQNSYNPEENLQKTIQGDTLETLTWMNALGKPIKVKKGNILESFEYDACGNCISIIDGEGQVTRQTFDGLGRITQKELPDGARLTFDYDLDSNLIALQLPNGNIWKATYDSMGRKISEQMESGRESTGEWEYTYIEGYLRETKDPLGRIRTYEYDSSGRLAQETAYGWQRNYTYDPRGLLILAEQVGSQSLSWLSSWFYTPREEHSIIERTYDADGHLTYESISLNSTLVQETHQEWEPGMRSLQIGDHERTFVYQNGRIAAVTSGRTYLTYTYDQSGALKSKETALSTLATHYNSSGLPEIISAHLPSGLLQETLRWNASGKLTSYHSPLIQKQFAYTPRGHLQAAGAESYTFDFGSVGTGIRTRAQNNQIPQDGLDAFGRVIAEIIDKYSLRTNYDSMGQVVSQGQRQFEWDPWGRLLKVTDPTMTWEASYDALGRRLQTRLTPANSSTITTTSLYDPEEEFQEIGIQIGNKTYWKLYGPDSCDALIDETGASAFLMHNALNELTAVITEQGTHTVPSTCSSYGPQTPPFIPADLLSYAQSLSWHSKSQDPTGLILMGKRYYDPKVGRFISTDPIGYPLCMDLYSYTNGDPINYMDLDGRFVSFAYQKTSVKGISNTLASLSADYGIGNSGAFQVGSFDLQNGAISFINGIQNSRSDSLESAHYLSQYARGAKIYGIYNASNLSGPLAKSLTGIANKPLSFGADVAECAMGHAGFHTPPVQHLRNQWTRFILTHGPEAKFLQICHSGGADHVKNALIASSESVRQRIIVLAINPSVIIPEELCFRSNNYMSRRDFVTRLDIMGRLKHRNELHILEPHPNAKLWDHEFASPTFERKIQDHINEYIDIYRR